MTYLKYGILLVFMNVVLLFSICAFQPVSVFFRSKLTNNELQLISENMIMENKNTEVDTQKMVLQANASGQRIIIYTDLGHEIQISNEEYDILLRIVEAEATGEDEDGKLLVANVILNRVKSEKFPNTVKEVVYQKDGKRAQFSPVSSGKIDRVVPSEETKSAVNRALTGEDISKGALYFASRKLADSSKMKWFDQTLTFLYQHGGHEFFK